MALTMNELLSPGFITAYILGFLFLVLTTRFLYDSFSEYWTEFVKPILLILAVLILGIVFCYVIYGQYHNSKLSGNFDIKETIKGNR